MQTDQGEVEAPHNVNTGNDIHEKIKQWDEFLVNMDLKKGEGYSAQLEFEVNFYSSKPSEILATKKVNTEQVVICETGFNMGHSALMFLESNPKVRYFGFDMGVDNHDKIAQIMKQKYPNRIEVIIGDSTKTLPNSIKHKKHIKQLFGQDYCDIISVDGGHHDPVPKLDIANFRAYCNDDDNDQSQTLLLLDDCPCDKSWCVDVTKTWNKLKDMKLINELGTYENEAKSRGLCWGHYNTKITQQEFESKTKEMSIRKLLS